MAEETLRDRIAEVLAEDGGSLFGVCDEHRDTADAVLAVLGDVVPVQPLRDLTDRMDAMSAGEWLVEDVAGQLRALLPAACNNTGASEVEWEFGRGLAAGYVVPAYDEDEARYEVSSDRAKERNEGSFVARRRVHRGPWEKAPTNTPAPDDGEAAVDEHVAAGRVRVFNSEDEFYDSLDEPAMPRSLTQRQIVELLERLAAGREEYAQSGGSGADHLRAEANTLRNAAQAAAGDLGVVWGLLPSWRWRDDEDPASAQAPELQADAKLRQVLAQPTPGPEHWWAVKCSCGAEGTGAGPLDGPWSPDHAGHPFDVKAGVREAPGASIPGPVPLGTRLLTPWGEGAASHLWGEKQVFFTDDGPRTASFALMAEWAEAHRARTEEGQ